jgi:hypothetical protein
LAAAFLAGAAFFAAGFFAAGLSFAPPDPRDFLSAAIRSTTLLPRGSLPLSSSIVTVLPFFLRSISSLSAST